MSSSESIIMTLLEQVRCLEEERDKALELSNSLNEKLRAKEECKKASSSKKSDQLKLKETLETLSDELEGIRLNEEQRQFNISELSKEKKDEQSTSTSNDSKMVELCKQYYGKMVAELQEERKVLQQKVEKLQNEIIEKDMKIAELQLGKV